MDRRQFAMLGLIASTRLLGQQSCDAPPPSGKKLPATRFKNSDIESRATKIVIQHLDVDAAKVTDKARFIQDLGADSLDVVDLVMAFEEAFEIEIDEDKAEKILTFGDAVKVITDLLRSAKRLTDENSSLINRPQPGPPRRARV